MQMLKICLKELFIASSDVRYINQHQQSPAVFLCTFFTASTRALKFGNIKNIFQNFRWKLFNETL